MWVQGVLVLCLLGAACSVAGSEAGEAPAARRGRLRVTRRTVSDRWLQTISELLGDANSRKLLEDSALRVQLPIGGARGEPLPVLLLPVPVPVSADTRDGREPIQTDSRRQFRPTANFQVRDEDRRIQEDRPQAAPEPKPASRDSFPASRDPLLVNRNQFSALGLEASDGEYRPSSPAPFQRPQDINYDYTPPQMFSGVSPQYLVELFQTQQPRDPSLPPLLLEDSPPRGEPAPDLPRVRRASGLLSALSRPLFGQKTPSPRQPTPGQQPPPLRFSKSVMLRGELTVNKADYTEPYTAWYDANTGSSRVDVHGGSASIYRNIGPDGSVQRVLARMDRADESAPMRRCMVMQSRGAAPADRAVPALPDLDKFSFDGYVEDAEGGPVERWSFSQVGAPGEMGGARGEALSYRHEILATRAQDNSAVPLKYTVAVDSSVLGPNSDTYEHRYLETREAQPDPAYLNIDVDRECGSVEKTDRIELVDTLREFTMLERDPSHDFSFKDYVKKFTRKYVDGVEEALRKNLLMQNKRWVESANRQGGTAKLALNWLSDRLEAELDTLLGIAQSAGILDAEAFPYSRGQARAEEDRLPRAFDWREEGGVTHVRYQGNCPACWAFSVIAAVEGALFVRTRRLVPLSDKCLLDCGHKPGKDTCSPTWLDSPYAHLRSRGILALNDYPPYEPKVDQCREERGEPVTFISAYVNVTSNSVPALKVAIRRHGPTVVLVDAKCKSFQYYQSGVLLDYRCLRELKKLNHAVTAVGWGKRLATHFILKNSWAASYGESGYIRIHGPSNTCGILTSPTYPRIEDADVHKLPAGDAAPLPDEKVGGAQL